MPESLQDALDGIESLLGKVANPRVACENRCNRTITLQYSQWDEPGEYAYRWNCDATAECGSPNEHFCRFQPVSADGYGETPLEAARGCREKLEALLEGRVEIQALEALDEEG